MTSMIDALGCAWAWVRSNARSQGAAARFWLEPLQAVLKNRRMPVMAGIGVLSLGIWWLTPPRERPIESVELHAELAETREALRTARQTLHLRARAIELAESEIEALTQELTKVRAAAASDPDAPILAADDPWLTKRAR